MLNKSTFEDGSYFLQRFLQSPKHIASVWPSSRFLADQMFHDLNLTSGDVVIEYGPGTGSFTQRVERLRNSGTILRYLGVEKDPGMHQYLTRRFPELEFVLGDAVDVLEFCKARALPAATAVISGLPMVLMNHRTVYGIFAATRDCLRADGVFRTFSYMHSYPSRRAAELRDLMRQCFEEYELSRPVVRNLPPAFTLTGRTPRVAPLHHSR
jgi:phosphatidylethanolamine/phosphatidyl-N-methylethanolamine N-methyltransferase